MDGFVHLHVHSHYSLLDGANRIGELVDTAKGFGMSALALTDHGNLFGAVDFYATARKAGIKPILGLEAYISPTTRQDRSMGNAHDACYHLILLAMNQTGWRNLIRLSSRSFREGFYYKPRVDRELLSELNEGLICTTACLGGEVPSALLAGQQDKARRIAGEYRDIFGPERFFIEVQHQGLADQDRVNPGLIALAKELGVGIVGTNDVHFLRREDKKAHEVLTAISTGKTLADGGALIYSPELYLKSPAEMREALRHWPESADNTLRIAEMCNVEVDFSAKHLPKFPTPNGEKPADYLGKLAWDGLARRMAGGEIPEAYRKRLEWELKVIDDKGYSSYFLIVNDFVQYARRNNIPAAPRGSGVATLLGYALGVADVDPLRYGLLFERFTDPARKEDPDIDIDICQEGRGKVIQYVREKYGHVAQIITYGTLKPRAVIRDVGRVMGMPLIEVDAICKKVPEGPKVTMAHALDEEPELKKLYETQPKVHEMVDYGKRLEGLARHSGVHAAGVIVCDQPLDGLVPLCTQSDSDELITQWDGPTCEKIGLMKMDFLGLRTLTTIQRARDLVRARSGKDIDPELLPLDDPKVFEIFCKGETDGIFQFESGGMKDILMKMRPGRIEEIIAANAMYRPGPMELIPSYIARKNGAEHIERVHELVDDILAETYGIMAYQEQVMQVLNRLGKLPLNRALTLIKAISKKKKEVINSERPNFVTGAEQNGIAPAESEQLFELILKFAGYGFNKAHSTRYAIVAYQTAYFKAYWPREFLAALLTFESSDTDKVVQYMNEAKRMGIRVAPPDINACDADFTVDGDRVRFGLAAVKGVGDKAVEAILTARGQAKRFKDLFDFCRQVDLRAVNRATIEALVKCGAFDALGASRAAMTAGLDSAIELGQTAASDRRSGQLSFFGGAGALAADEAATPRFPDVEPWSESQMLKAEKETLGFFVSSHPLVEHARELVQLSSPHGVNLAHLEEINEGTPVTIGCMVSEVRNTTTKTGRSAGKRMAMLTVEDVNGKADAVVFSDTYEKFGPFIEKEAIVFLRGTVDRRRERPSIIVDEIIPIEQALSEMTGCLDIRLPASLDYSDALAGTKDVLARHRGQCPVRIALTPLTRMDVRVCVRLEREWFVHPDQAVMKELAAVPGVGDEALVLHPKQTNGNARNNRFPRKPAPAAGRQPAMFNGGAGAPGQGAEAPVSAAVTRFN